MKRELSDAYEKEIPANRCVRAQSRLTDGGGRVASRACSVGHSLWTLDTQHTNTLDFGHTSTLERWMRALNTYRRHTYTHRSLFASNSDSFTKRGKKWLMTFSTSLLLLIIFSREFFERITNIWTCLLVKREVGFSPLSKGMALPWRSAGYI